jgi:hypothetical protein
MNFLAESTWKYCDICFTKENPTPVLCKLQSAPRARHPDVTEIKKAVSKVKKHVKGNYAAAYAYNRQNPMPQENRP